MGALISKAWVASLLLVSACSHLETRPLLSHQGTRQPAFDEAYDAGKRQLLAGRAGLALALFDKALRLSPRSVPALNGIAAAYDDLHLPDKAAPFYQLALEIEPENGDTLNNMAFSALIAGRPEQARQYFRRALALRPDDAVIKANASLVEKRTPPSPGKGGRSPEKRPRLELVGLSRSRLVLGEAPYPSRN
ncbi:MAG TPA: tetratricopeptide repeat protein [Magnetospirillum sp.]|jgi:Flp pilus assembly protein TadD|nr:tetratricopeptide repeat protein [Magnetospirillum sp.]